MHVPTVVFGAAMFTLGVAAYLLTGRESATALIPAFVGLPVLLCGFLAAKARKPALIAALVLSVLAVLGPLGRIIPMAARGEFEFNYAVAIQLVFIGLAIGLITVLIPSLRSKA